MSSGGNSLLYRCLTALAAEKVFKTLVASTGLPVGCRHIIRDFGGVWGSVGSVWRKAKICRF